MSSGRTVAAASRRLRTALLAPGVRVLPSRRALAAQAAGGPSDVAPAAQQGAALQPGDQGAGLAQLSERAGFLPRPDAFDENLKPGFRGGRPLLIFFLCNAVPFGALLYYLRSQRSDRASLSLLSLPAAAGDVVAEALRVIRTASSCFLMQQPDGTGIHSAVLHVDPHPPEGTAYVPPTEPLPMVPQLERNVITDIFESPSAPGLAFIHFAVSRSSPQGAAVLAGHRRASLLYVSGTRGAYCSVGGSLSVLADGESRRRYWRSLWALAFLPVGPAAQASSSRTPTASVSAPEQPAEAPKPWEQEEYLLLRLSVDEVSLSSVVDGPQRWEQRRVRRLGAGTSGPEWALAS